MMLLTGVTLRRMDPAPASGPTLPSPSRSAALAASATASLGAAMATAPRPSIRDVMAAKPPRRKRTADAPPAVSSTDAPPAVLSTALEAANGGKGALVVADANAATANTVSALKNARAARAVGLTRAVQTANTVPALQNARAARAAGLARAVQTEEGVGGHCDGVEGNDDDDDYEDDTEAAMPPQQGMLSRLLGREDDAHDPKPDTVATAATAMLTSMGLTAVPAAVNDRYDMWKVCCSLTRPLHHAPLGVSQHRGTHRPKQVRPMDPRAPGGSTHRRRRVEGVYA